MRAIFSIIRQTVRESLRSKVFHALILLTIAATFLLPLTVAGDGTATAAVQAIITYSLQAITVLLTLAAVWLGCSGLSREIESHRIHMIMTKPVYPWMAWMGKWLGVVAVSGIVLMISAMIVFLSIQWRIHSDEFSADEVATARNEVLTGRRVYEPVRPDFQRLVDAEYQRLLADRTLAPEHDPGSVRGELLRQQRGRASEVQPQATRRWRFQGVALRGNDAASDPFFRYRLYVASARQTAQRETRGIWRVLNPDAHEEEFRELLLPMQSRGGLFHEVSLPAAMVAEDGSVTIEYFNLDPEGEIVVFQPADGPRLMVPASGFAANYWRGITVIMMRIAFFAALGCALGAMFSGPVALFLAFAYAAFSIVIDGALGGVAQGFETETFIPQGYNLFSYAVLVVMDKVVISLSEFDIPDLLSTGRLVSGARMASTAFLQVILRGAPLAVVAVMVFSRRELGKVVRR